MRFTARRNNVWKKIFSFVVAFTLLASVTLTGIQTYRVSALSKSVEQYRSDLADARRANDRYADTYRQATETNTELGKCLSRHVSTISELREQLKTVRSRYEQMQEILANLEDSRHLSDRGDDTDDSRSNSL